MNDNTYGIDTTTCDLCKGTGSDVNKFEQTPDGSWDTIRLQCPRCKGTGRVYDPRLRDDLTRRIDNLTEQVAKLESEIEYMGTVAANAMKESGGFYANERRTINLYTDALEDIASRALNAEPPPE